MLGSEFSTLKIELATASGKHECLPRQNQFDYCSDICSLYVTMHAVDKQTETGK